MSTINDFNRVVLEFMQDDPLTVTYQSNSASYSDSTGINTITTVSIPCQAIFLEASPRIAFGDGSKDGTEIQAGDKLLFMRPPEKTDLLRLPLVINPVLDRILVGTVSYRIIKVKQTNPSASNCVLYELYVRN